MKTTAFLSLLLGPGLFALPSGCGGTLGIVYVNVSGWMSPVWTCAGVSRDAIFGGSTIMLNAGIQSSSASCADFCTSGSAKSGMNVAILDSNNGTCKCWSMGIPNTGGDNNLPVSEPGVTLIDFFDKRSLC